VMRAFSLGPDERIAMAKYKLRLDIETDPKSPSLQTGWRSLAVQILAGLVAGLVLALLL
jgi:hypothetical protein